MNTKKHTTPYTLLFWAIVYSDIIALRVFSPDLSATEGLVVLSVMLTSLYWAFESSMRTLAGGPRGN